MQEYVEFLNDLPREGAARRVPRMAASHPLLPVPPAGEPFTVPEPFSGDMPAVGVSWEDAKAYCEWRSSKDPEATYRLPTDLEWEKAARGVDGRTYPWGNRFDWAFFNGARSQSDGCHLLPSGATPLDDSPYRVRDLAGNAYEWCENWADESRGLKHHRGGSFLVEDPRIFRSASRFWAMPTSVGGGFGFRVVRVPR